jgi:hypothetical protein
MRKILLLIILCCFNCSNQRVILLPEVTRTKITKVLDVSPAYVFYDETQPDSSLLNRKNLISTTNWLVNVDKRLSLRQAIPHIKFMQDKKRNAQMHKNENAKNFYTCNNASINNLGFIEFTDVFYKNENPDFIEFSKSNQEDYTLIKCYQDGSIRLIDLDGDVKIMLAEIKDIKKYSDFYELLESIESNHIILFFEDTLSFQGYITIKSYLDQLPADVLKISKIEYLFQ